LQVVLTATLQNSLSKSLPVSKKEILEAIATTDLILETLGGIANESSGSPEDTKSPESIEIVK
jgi:hypothetical protein